METIEAPVNGSENIPVISTEAQVISPKDIPTIQQQTHEAKEEMEKMNPPHPNGVPKDDEAPSSQQPVSVVFMIIKQHLIIFQ